MGMNSRRISYNVDLVFCIDATASMSPVIDMVKNNALHFHRDLLAAMQPKNKLISNLRIRIIAYRDYISDLEDAMLATDFFRLPEDQAAFERCIQSIQAKGGGDDPEDGLEALAYAIHSDWDNQATRRRHVIVVWTDAATHPLGYGAKARNYPTKMAKDFSTLSDWWGDRQYRGLMDENTKRLVLFAPNEDYWTTISDNWDYAQHYPSVAGKGLAEYDYQRILDAICNTI